jgi:hypothetical protein
MIMIVIFFPLEAYGQAVNAGYQGGVTDGYEYQEVIYISGEPIPVKGTYRIIAGRLRNNRVSDRHVYELTNIEKGVKISRSITLMRELVPGNGQTIENTSVDRFTETITIGSNRYKLEHFQLSKSILMDYQPAADYYSGDWYSRKIYSLNNSKEEFIEVISMGSVVGYSNKWSYTETQTIDNIIEAKLKENPWKGTYRIAMSTSQKRDITYVSNEPTQISFRGRHTEVTLGESILKTSYQMPGKKDGEFNIYTVTFPKYKSLPIRNIRDIGGHWAERDIEELFSFGILDSPGDYFGPRITMTRGEFARAIALAIGLEYDKNGREIAFEDVTDSHPDHLLIKAIAQNDIIRGTSPGRFSPGGELTRATALTIMIRALGLERLAPADGYSTSFVDDRQIPLWAKDSIYVAHKIGLLLGDGSGRAYPNSTMSKAEAATFINRFIRHLRNEMTPDYRERIL